MAKKEDILNAAKKAAEVIKEKVEIFSLIRHDTLHF